MDLVPFCIAALATWRLAHFLHSEDGPWNVMTRLRDALAGRRIGILACFLCISVWPALSAALLLGPGWREFLLLWPALSAAAVLVERVAFPATFVDVLEYSEDTESINVLRSS
jgi:hypothetical protein